MVGIDGRNCSVGVRVLRQLLGVGGRLLQQID